MGPGWISPKKAIKKVGQVLDVHRLAQVLNAENDPLPPKSFNTDLDLRPNLGVAGCVSQQVGDRSAQQRNVEVPRSIPNDLGLEPCFGQCSLVIVEHLLGQRGQAGRVHPACANATVSLRQEQHVVDDSREALKLLQVGCQHFADVGSAQIPQGQLVARLERGQWSAQFVRNVGVEAFHLCVSLLYVIEETVELIDERNQFQRLQGSVKSLMQSIGRKSSGLLREMSDRCQAYFDQKEPPERDDDRSTDRGDSWVPALLHAEPNSTFWAFGVHSADPDLVFAGTKYGDLFRSLDGGRSWFKEWRAFPEITAIAWTPFEAPVRAHPRSIT